MVNFASALTTPVKRVVTLYSVNNFCRIGNINLLISGFGKFYLFDGVRSKEQNIFTKLYSVLGFTVKKEIIASFVFSIKCKREVDKSEKLFKGLFIFKEKALQMLKEQIKRTDRVWNVCGKS